MKEQLLGRPAKPTPAAVQAEVEEEKHAAPVQKEDSGVGAGGEIELGEAALTPDEEGNRDVLVESL